MSQLSNSRENPPGKAKARLGLIVAIPFLTTGVVLAFGLLVVQLDQKVLVDSGGHLSPLKVNHLLDSIFAATVIAAAGALAAGAILAWAIVKPFKTINKAASKLAKGDFSERINVGGTHELNELSDTLNQMIVSLNHFLINRLSGGSLNIDKKGVVISLNGDAEAILGCDAAALAGKHISDTFLAEGENASFRDALLAILEHGEDAHKSEFRILRTDGARITVQMSPTILRGATSILLGISIRIEDVTDVKHIQEQLRRFDRIATVNSFAAGIAHNVRNPLCSIRGFAQLISERSGDNPECGDYSRRIMRDADRINHVIERLFSSLQPGTPEWKYHEVESVVRDVLYGTAEGDADAR